MIGRGWDGFAMKSLRITERDRLNKVRAHSQTAPPVAVIAVILIRRLCMAFVRTEPGGIRERDELLAKSGRDEGERSTIAREAG